MSGAGHCGRERARLVLLACVTLAALGCSQPAVAQLWSPTDELRLRVSVEIARTADERRRGLAGRDALAPDEGLLLVFPVSGEVCVANAFVTFPIDAVFADALGRVVAVESGILAGDAQPRCHAPVAAVLELAGGAALSVQVGDVLERRP